MYHSSAVRQTLDVYSVSSARHRVVLNCVRRYLTEPISWDSEDSLQSSPWQDVLQTASDQNVMPLFCKGVLKGFVRGTPSCAVEQMKHQAMSFALTGMRRAVQLFELIEALTRENIRALPLKGPVLAATAYGDVGLRNCLDLDVLVCKDDVARAASVLTRLGFSGWELTATETTAHLRSGYEHSFTCPRRKLSVDLHWALAPPYFPLQLTFDELWERRRTVRVGGKDLPAFSIEDSLLYLCFHGAKHYWSHLNFFCDVAAAIREMSAVELYRTLELSEQSGTRRVVLLGLHLAQRVIGSQLPEHVILAISKDASIDRIGTEVVRRLSAVTVAEDALRKEIGAARFYLRVRERWRDRACFLSKIAAPNIRDWQGSPLPPSLAFLHVVKRPFRHLLWLMRRPQDANASIANTQVTAECQIRRGADLESLRC